MELTELLQYVQTKYGFKNYVRFVEGMVDTFKNTTKEEYISIGDIYGMEKEKIVVTRDEWLGYIRGKHV